MTVTISTLRKQYQKKSVIACYAGYVISNSVQQGHQLLLVVTATVQNCK